MKWRVVGYCIQNLMFLALRFWHTVPLLLHDILWDVLADSHPSSFIFKLLIPTEYRYLHFVCRVVKRHNDKMWHIWYGATETSMAPVQENPALFPFQIKKFRQPGFREGQCVLPFNSFFDTEDPNVIPVESRLLIIHLVNKVQAWFLCLLA